MGVIESRTFKNGDQVAVVLPDALGIPADFALRLEWEGQTVTMSPASEDIDAKRTWAEVLEKLAALGPVGEVEVRNPDIFPDRPGLYSPR
ncbi:hypothetical protein [Sphingomonas sp.]|uniref:hypothetical protein n=1 Tax=Sphingomonas sp. TaxID=28214 RepID=UPI0033429064